MTSTPIPSIAFNTFKGGVSKTTSVYNFGWYFSTQGCRTLLVDVDPQCNLSQLFLKEELHEMVFRESRPNDGESRYMNIGEALGEVLGGNELPPSADVETFQHAQNPNLFLLAGSINVTSYEESLAAAETMKASFTRNIPGALYHLIQRAARHCNADLIIIDTSPSMGCLNMVIVMSSTYFLVPCQADYFSWQALQSLRKRITEVNVPGKGTWLERMAALQEHTQPGKYPMPKQLPIFLGVLTQMFTMKRGKVTKAFEVYIQKITKEINEHLIPLLGAHGMLMAKERYDEAKLDIVLGRIQNFNRFGPMAQEQGLPIIALLEIEGRLVNCEGDKRTKLSQPRKK